MPKLLDRFTGSIISYGIVLDIAVNEQVDNATILGSKTNRDISNGIATSELFKDFEYQLLLVGTKFH